MGRQAGVRRPDRNGRFADRLRRGLATLNWALPLRTLLTVQGSPMAAKRPKGQGEAVLVAA